MDDYIEKIRVKYNHPDSRKPQHYQYKHSPIIYGAKVQYAEEDDDIPFLDADDILRVKSIVGELLFYGNAVNNKLLVSLSKIGKQQAAATQATNDAIMKLLDYVATHPSDGITFRASDMVLAAHSDAEYFNVTKACSRAGTHIMLSENVLLPAFNRPILTIDQII